MTWMLNPEITGKLSENLKKAKTYCKPKDYRNIN